MNRLPGIPVAGYADQVLVHPSQICHIGELDQGLIAKITQRSLALWLQQVLRVHVHDLGGR